MHNSFEILGVKVNAFDVQEVLQFVNEWIVSRVNNGSKYICVTNVNSIVVAQKDKYLKEITNKSDISVCDGMPLFWLSKLAGFKAKERVAGLVLMEKALEFSEANGYSSYFYGSTSSELKKIVFRISQKYPRLKIVGYYAPPFRPLTQEERMSVVSKMNDSGADFVWVGLGYPKQEIWMYEFRECLKGKVLVGVGAAFDFFPGDKK